MTNILIVEDSEDDLFLLERVFAKLKLEHQIQAVHDGEAAVVYLEDSSKPLPRLILLDLHLPKRSGFEVIAWVRGHAQLKSIPIVVLTSSREPNDLKRAYDLGANGYMVKPGILDDLEVLLKASYDFWITANLTLTAI